jgi:ribosome-associated toxin RatA of RatAB toxin-antitoxin module
MTKSVLNLAYPRELIYKILSDYAAYQEWLPGCRSSKILNENGSTTDVETVVEGMKTLTMELRFESSPHDVLRFSMLKCKELKAYSGEYRLMDAANNKGTVVICEVEMDAGAMVPKFMMDRMIRKVLEEMGQALQVRVKAFSALAVSSGPKKSDDKKRRRRILQIANTPSGPRIWYVGKVYTPPGQ